MEENNYIIIAKGVGSLHARNVSALMLPIKRTSSLLPHCVYNHYFLLAQSTDQDVAQVKGHLHYSSVFRIAVNPDLDSEEEEMGRGARPRGKETASVSGAHPWLMRSSMTTPLASQLSQLG